MLRKGSGISAGKSCRALSRAALLSFLALASSFHFAVSSPPEASGNFRLAAASPTRNHFCFVV
jgi:hypothetical protein